MLALGTSEGLALDQMLDIFSDAVTATPWLKGKLPVLKGEPSDITLDIRTMRKDVHLGDRDRGLQRGRHAGNFRRAGVTGGGGRRRLGRQGSRRSAAIFPRLHVAGLSGAGRTALRLLPS